MATVYEFMEPDQKSKVSRRSIASRRLVVSAVALQKIPTLRASWSWVACASWTRQRYLWFSIILAGDAGQQLQTSCVCGVTVASACYATGAPILFLLPPACVALNLIHNLIYCKNKGAIR